MKDNQLFPFERNRYYSGKMLTSSDFQAEQAYFNNKRRFMNSFLYGSGIICGCNVFSLDDLSLMLESGAAIDDYGREIIVDVSAVKKLSAIEGFSEIKGNEALLCMRYQETGIHSVFAVNYEKQGDSYEYNRIREGYELFLKDDAEMEEGFRLESDFFLQRTLYEDRDFCVELTMPAAVCKGMSARVDIKLKKLSEDRKPISWSGIIQMPFFVEEYGKHELQINFHKVCLEKGQWEEKNYWIWVDRADGDETNMVFRDEMGNQTFRVRLRDAEPHDLVTKQIAGISLEMLSLEEKKDYVPLARLKLMRTDSAYIIEEIIEEGIKRYISAPGWEEKRREYNAYFRKEHHQKYRVQGKEIGQEKESAQIMGHYHTPLTAAGKVEIPIGADARKGDICYSGEIMHGLGRGDVYVALGYESCENDSVSETNMRSTIYGSVNLFDKRAGMGQIETAVKVMKDKGSFIAAAKLLKHVDSLVLTFRWTAVLFPPSGGEDASYQEYGNKGIAPETPTVILQPKESWYFQVKFSHMEPCSVVYELTEEGSGEITPEGVYTAPGREGVYEIRICCADIPAICTYAYAIVRSSKEQG